MKSLLFVSFLFWTAVAAAQTTINVDKVDGLPFNSVYTVSGTPFVNYRFVRLTDGTPYFKDAWMKGLVVSDKNLRFQSAQVKLDLLDNTLHFLTAENEELVCTLPIKEVTLIDTVNGRSYYFFHTAFVPLLASEKKDWYLQLVNGKASLFQAFNKTVQETKPYGSSVTEQKIVTTEEFIILRNGAPVRAKKLKELPEIMSDKKSELEAFLKQDAGKNASTAERMAAVVSYYNTLQ
jgi:hypothetical protein